MTKPNTPYAEREVYDAYVYQGVTYVPHYRNLSVYVGPGYPIHTQKRWSAEELVEAGATPKQTALWVRGTYGTVTDKDL